MKHITQLGILLSFTAIIIMSSCTKPQDEIIGTWTYHNFGSPLPDHTTWTFNTDGELLRILENENGIYYDSCKYEINTTLIKKQIFIEGSKMLPGQADLGGTYNIEKFKNNILVITRIKLEDDETGGAYLRCEFTR
jgi:hypothetical protein